MEASKLTIRDSIVSPANGNKLIGKAKPSGLPDEAKLESVIFRTFYSPYNVIALDDEYTYALVAGKNLNTLDIVTSYDHPRWSQGKIPPDSPGSGIRYFSPDLGQTRQAPMNADCPWPKLTGWIHYGFAQRSFNSSFQLRKLKAETGFHYFFRRYTGIRQQYVRSLSNHKPYCKGRDFWKPERSFQNASQGRHEFFVCFALRSTALYCAGHTLIRGWLSYRCCTKSSTWDPGHVLHAWAHGETQPQPCRKRHFWQDSFMRGKKQTPVLILTSWLPDRQIVRQLLPTCGRSAPGNHPKQESVSRKILPDVIEL